MNPSSEKKQLLFGVACLVLSSLLLGFHLWLSLFHVGSWSERVEFERKALDELKQEQQELFDPDLRAFLEKYSATVEGIESLLALREEVFSGSLDPEQFEPVVVLDVLKFFGELRDRLADTSVLSQFSVDEEGKVSLLIQSISYSAAAQQMEMFRFDQPEGEEALPPLFTDVQVSSISRMLLTGKKAEQAPELLRERGESYDFMIQMQINPDYYFALQDQQEAVEEEPVS